MTKRMMIDSTHAEETRVVVLDGSRLEDFDVETSTKRQLKGNIYLAKVVRVEPSLQAAFVEYGGNRHGFLAFSEIHPDYYQIPVADRQRLLDMEAEEARREEEEEDRAAEAAAGDAEGAPDAEPESSEADEAPPSDMFVEPAAPPPPAQPAEIATEVVAAFPESLGGSAVADEAGAVAAAAEPDATNTSAAEPGPEPAPEVDGAAIEASAEVGETASATADEAATIEASVEVLEAEPATDEITEAGDDITVLAEPIPEQPPPETVGGEGDGAEDSRERRIPPRFLRNYKIQEVIKRRQILLVQVVKEERGTKGAALTTYLSLAGRFSVLMPNSPRGGGISRKITSPADRRRLKEIMAELDIPKGMGLIVRTAGANRPKPEIKRDCEYLLRLWDDIRDHTMSSVAPALIYEEASLIKRAIRDVYSRDIDEILVDGEEGWRAAHEFMRMLMPSHAKKVQLWKNGGMPLFAKHQVEQQLDSMLLPTVQLRSGGYLVINQAEALVAIDVNSGRSTRERGIEETALRTNLEAADEVARQLRLRDLAGLIVIDFIDMEQRKHNAMVEKRLKEALKNDRARIQVGHISHFGLMEMSRQRLRPSLAETSFIMCAHCGGTGHVRSTESAAIHVLRGIEEEGAKRRAAEVVVYAAPQVALYILNHKRERLADIEARYGMRVVCLGDAGQMTSQFRIDRVRAQVPSEVPAAITQDVVQPPPELEPEAEAPEIEDEEDETEAETEEEATAAAGDGAAEDGDQHRRRRRRRRRGVRRDEAPAAPAPESAPETESAGVEAAETHVEGVPEHAEAGEEEQRARRRGRRGGRRRRPEGSEMPPHAEPGADQPDLPPVYIGPTPANPYGGHSFDIFDVLEQAEAAHPEPITAPAVDLAAAATPAPAEDSEAAATTALEPVQQAEAPRPEPLAEPVAETAVTEPVELAGWRAPEPVAVVEPEPARAETAPVEPEPETVEAPAVEAEAAPEAVREPHAESQPETAMSQHVAAAEPALEAMPAQQPEPELAVAVDDRPPEPLIKPIIVGGDQEVIVEKKRGWWRR